jgi:O-antigen/teichoic acid export membrane protein
MNTASLTVLVSLILALSIASERLVEIIKGVFPFLNVENKNETLEGWRRASLHVLAVLSAIATAYLSADYIPKEVADPAKGIGVLGLGLLASGGSSFWNSIATYMLKLKDLKKLEVEDKKKPE